MYKTLAILFFLLCNVPLVFSIQNTPSLGVFSMGENRESYHLWINGVRIDIRNCPDVKRLKELVGKGYHRRITNLPLPGGYVRLYPESIEEVSRNASCGVIDRLEDFFFE